MLSQRRSHFIGYTDDNILDDNILGFFINSSLLFDSESSFNLLTFGLICWRSILMKSSTLSTLCESVFSNKLIYDPKTQINNWSASAREGKLGTMPGTPIISDYGKNIPPCYIMHMCYYICI